MRILVVRPIVSQVPNEAIVKVMKLFASSDVELEAVKLENGPESIVCRHDIMQAQPGVLQAVMQAEKSGYDGCIVNCFADPGVEIARETCRIPVIGPGQSGMLLASALGSRIGIVTISQALSPVIREHSLNYGLVSQIAGINAVDIPLSEFGSDGFVEKLAQCGEELVTRNGVDVLVFGCTGMAGLEREVSDILAVKGIRVPIVDPSGAAISLMESMIRLKVSHSLKKYGNSPKLMKL